MNTAIESEQDFYALLGVGRDASPRVIRESYRRLMQTAGNHPDLGGDSRTAALLNGAYAVLKDPEKRQLYDARLIILERIAAGFDVEPEVTIPDPREKCLFCEQSHNFILDDTDEIGCEKCGSPLRALESDQADSCDKRSIQRLGRELDILIYRRWDQPLGSYAKTQDISPRGMRLTTSCNLQPGQLIRVVSTVVDAVGRVTHHTTRNEGWRTLTVAGVSFLTRRIRRPVGAFVSRHV